MFTKEEAKKYVEEVLDVCDEKHEFYDEALKECNGCNENSMCLMFYIRGLGTTLGVLGLDDDDIKKELARIVKKSMNSIEKKLEEKMKASDD